MNFIFKNKKYLFVDSISNMCSCAIVFVFLLSYSINFIYMSVSIIFLFNKKTITINKLTKHNNHKWLVV